MDRDDTNGVRIARRRPRVRRCAGLCAAGVITGNGLIFNRVVSAGAQVQMPMADQFWGDRAGAIADPAGYTWWIVTRKEDLTQAEMQQRAAKFFKQMPQPTPQ